MAERLMRLGHTSVYMQRLARALTELSVAFERHAAGAPFIVPESCNEFIEINRLILSMQLKRNASASHVTHPLTQGQPTQREASKQYSTTQSLVDNTHTQFPNTPC